MRRLLVCLITCYFVPFNLGLFNVTGKHKINDDYYLNYDYELTNNSEDDNFDLQSDSLIFPNPKLVESKYNGDILPKVDLPDDSLADTDLRDHDFIDNLMYVYYGSHSRIDNSSYGSEIIIIGSVLSCAAQLLTIFCVLLKKNFSGKKEITKLFLHLMSCLCLSNLIFMLGVYSTKSPVKCQIVAILLHYLYVLTAVWIFMYCIYIYKSFINKSSPNLGHLLLMTYGVPGVFSLVTSLFASTNYETKKFCFVSVQKGMLINYMLPVSILIITTTIYALNGIRKVNLELSKLEMTSETESLNILRIELETSEGSDKKSEMLKDEVAGLKECKNCLKALCVVQTSYDVVWFTAVLALENVSYSSIMPVSYTLFSLLLNWFIFAKSKSFLPTIINYNTPTICIEDDMDGDKSISCFTKSADNIPLLVDNESYTEIHELRLDTISTISN